MTDTFNTALYNLTDKLLNWVTAFIENLPNIIIATLVMVLSFFIARYIRKVVANLVSKRVSQISISNAISRIAAVVVVLSGLFFALSVLNLSKALSSLLAGAGIMGIVIGLALQSTLANTIAGIVLSFRKKIQIGHWVEALGYEGEIIDINLKDFTLKEADNNIVVIPNKSILDNPLKNYSLTTKMRVFINCGVSYDSDLEAVKKLTKQVIHDNFEQIRSPDDVEFYYTEFGDSSINYLCRFWIDSENALEKLRAQTTAIIEIKKAYDAAGISIPFPIRTVKLENQNL